MKRFAIVFALVLVLAISAGAQDFGKFTAEVPDGWTASQNGPTVIFTKNDNTSSLTITVDESGGANAAQLAEAFVGEFEKTGQFSEITKPEADKDGDYSFDMTNKQGVVSNCLLRVDGGKYMLMVISGAEHGGDDIMKILNSVKEK